MWLTCDFAAMFEPKDNPGYDKLINDAAQLISKWTMNDWYASSTDAEISEEANGVHTEAGVSHTDLDMG